MAFTFAPCNLKSRTSSFNAIRSLFFFFSLKVFLRRRSSYRYHRLELELKLESPPDDISAPISCFAPSRLDRASYPARDRASFLKIVVQKIHAMVRSLHWIILLDPSTMSALMPRALGFPFVTQIPKLRKTRSFKVYSNLRPAFMLVHTRTSAHA